MDLDHQEPLQSEFERFRNKLFSEGVDEEGGMELRRYLKDKHKDVKQDEDIVAWWSVCVRKSIYLSF